MKNTRQLFERQLSELTTVLNLNIHSNQNILDTIKWCRDEYAKVPFIYPGDDYVVSCIKFQAFKGFSLHESIEFAKKEINKAIKLRCLYMAMGR